MLDIVHIHIPKTAGTSLGTLFNKIYMPNQILRVHGRIKENQRLMTFDETIRSELNTSTKVITGHIPYSAINTSISCKRKITWLRKPLDRLLSHYYYWRQLPTDRTNNQLHHKVRTGSISISEFIESKAMQNLMSKYVSVEHIKDFDFIGLMKNFEVEIQSLCKLMNWPQPNILPHALNATSQDYERFKNEIYNSKELLTLFAKHNELDMQLYRTVEFK